MLSLTGRVGVPTSENRWAGVTRKGGSQGRVSASLHVFRHGTIHETVLFGVLLV